MKDQLFSNDNAGFAVFTPPMESFFSSTGVGVAAALSTEGSRLAYHKVWRILLLRWQQTIQPGGSSVLTAGLTLKASENVEN